MNLDVPASVELKITQTVPGVRGDTVSNATKPATMETGIEVQVPLFIKEGDTIHFVVKKTGTEKNNTYTAVKILIIPQEYFMK